MGGVYLALTLRLSGMQKIKMVVAGIQIQEIFSHGRNFPPFKWALSTILPKMMSLITSQICGAITTDAASASFTP